MAILSILGDELLINRLELQLAMTNDIDASYASRSGQGGMNDLPYLGYEGCQLFSFLRLSKWIGFGVFERTVDGNVCITVHHLLVEQLGRVHVL